LLEVRALCYTTNLEITNAYKILTGDNEEKKKDNVKEDWRKLLSDEVHDLYVSPDSIRMIKGRVA
jgi:hypothetical protein